MGARRAVTDPGPRTVSLTGITHRDSGLHADDCADDRGEYLCDLLQPTADGGQSLLREHGASGCSSHVGG